MWLLATLSYLLSEDGVNGTDCVVGDNSNGCDTTCARFYSGFPIPGGYYLVGCKSFSFYSFCPQELGCL